MSDVSLTPDHQRIDALERDSDLLRPTTLRKRVLALEWLEEWLDGARDDEPFRRRAHSLQQRLADVQAHLCEAIRTDIRQGRAATALQPWCPPHIDDAEGYDHLDALLGDVFAFAEPGDAIAPLDPDMVFYQPTPVRHVFDLVKRASMADDDVFVDLGSGLGHVPMLVSMLTGARCIGVEREHVYVHGARRSAEALRLDNVSFVAQDVREADLSSGTTFYLYTPFTGAILRDVLGRLRRESLSRPIRLITFGPCTAVVAAEHWLRPLGECRAHRVAVFIPVGD